MNAWAWAVLAASTCFADATQPASVRATRLDGQMVTGEWLAIEQGKLILKDVSDAVPLTELLEIAWPTAQTQPAASAPAEEADLLRVYLHDGTRIMGRVVSGDARGIEFDVPGMGKLALPLSTLAAVAWPTARQEVVRQVFEQALAKPETGKDMLLVLTGEKVQTLPGAAESLSPQDGIFRWRDRAIPLWAERTCGLIFARPLEAPPRAPALCTLVDGTLWAGQLTTADAATLDLVLTSGREITLPLHRLKSIRLNSDRVIFLSDLDPAEEHFKPFGTTTWPWRKDRSVANGPLRIGAEVYDRGIGVHSQSRLVYSLDGKYRQFIADVGIDAATGALGNVIFRVLADGKEVFNSGPVRGGEAPRALQTGVENVRRFELCVDFGEDLDVGDHANWAAARLVK